MRKATFRFTGLSSRAPRPSQQGNDLEASSSSAVTFRESEDRRRAFPQVDNVSLSALIQDRPAFTTDDALDLDPQEVHSHALDSSSLHDYDDFHHWFDSTNEVDGEMLEVEQLEQGIQIEEEDAHKRYQSSVSSFNHFSSLPSLIYFARTIRCYRGNLY